MLNLTRFIVYLGVMVTVHKPPETEINIILVFVRLSVTIFMKVVLGGFFT